MSRLTQKVKIAVLAAMFAGCSFTMTLAEEPAKPATPPAKKQEEKKASSMSAMQGQNQALQSALAMIEKGQKTQDFALYNEGLAKAEVALAQMERTNRAMDLELRDKLQNTMDDIDTRRGVSSKPKQGLIGQLKKVQRKTEADAIGTKPGQHQRRTEGRSTPVAQDPRANEQQRRMENIEKAEKKSGGWKDTLGKIWGGAKAIFNGVRGAADVITGINNMRVGIDKLRKFGKDKKGFLDKTVDIAAGISGMGDGFDRTQRGISRLGEAYQHFAGSKPEVTTTKL